MLACKLNQGNTQYTQNLDRLSQYLGVPAELVAKQIDNLETNKVIKEYTIDETSLDIASWHPLNNKDTTSMNVKLNPPNPQFSLLIISDFFPPHNINHADQFLYKFYHEVIQDKLHNISLRILVSNFISLEYRKFDLFPIPYPNVYRELFIENLGGLEKENWQPPKQNHVLQNSLIVDSHLTSFKPDVVLRWSLGNFNAKFQQQLNLCKVPSITKQMVLEEKTTGTSNRIMELSRNKLPN